MEKTLKKIVFLLSCFLHLSVFANPQKPLIVVLDWFINTNHAPLFVAAQEGFFAKQGLQIKFITPADATEGEKMVAANRADIALTYQPALTYHVSNGLPIVRFATLVDRPLNCFIVLAHGKIRLIKDLKRKRIGSSSSEIDNIIFSTMLESSGLNLKDIDVVNVGFNLVSSLVTNRIDGFMGGMRNFEPLAIKAAGKSSRVFYPEDYGFPQYDELIFVANKNKIHDQSLVKFTYALKEGISYLCQNPRKSWQKFATLHPELDNRLNEEAWFVTLPYFASNPAKLNRQRYQELAEFMWKKKVIKYLPKTEEYAVELK